MSRLRRLLALTLLSVLSTNVPEPSWAAEPAGIYTKKATWAATMVDLREIPITASTPAAH